MTDQTASFALPRRLPVAKADGRIADLPWPVGLYFFTVVIPIGFDVGPLVVTTLRLMLLVMVLPLTAQLFAGRFGRLTATDALFIGFVLWSGVAIGVNNPNRAVEFVGSNGIEFFGGYMMGRAYIRSAEALQALTRLFVLFLVLTLPFAIYETLTSQSPILDMIRAVPGLITTSNNGTEERMGLIRVQLTFAHQIHYGLFASLAFSLTFIGLKGRIGDAQRYFCSAAIALCIVLALSSGALLALVLQSMLIAWNAALARIRWRWHLLAGLVVAAYLVIDLLSNRSPIQVFMSYATFSPGTAFYRAMIFDYGMKNVWASPVFGIGLNDWVRPSSMHSGTVDNFWLVAAMKYGIPGALLVASGYLIGLVQVIRRSFGTDPALNQMRMAWVFTFLALTFTLSTVALWTNIYSFVFFLFAAGLWLIEAQPAGTPAAAPGPPGRVRGAPPRRSPTQPGPSQPGPFQPDPALAARADAPASGRAPASGTAPAAGGPRYTRFPPTGRASGGGPGPLAES